MIKDFLKEEIVLAVQEAYPDTVLPHFEVEPSDHADFASNIALVLSKFAGANPREVAEKIQNVLLSRETFTEAVESVEIAGPGFLNFTVGLPLLLEGVREVQSGLHGGFPFLSGEKINLEFISVNPTGKLHIGHGRGGFYGDALGKIFSCAGAFLTREFYINNSRESKQIKELGKTALGRGEQYKTPALEEKISQIDFSGMSEEEAGFALSEKIQEDNQNFIEKTLGIPFDLYYSEDEELRAKEKTSAMRQRLESLGLTYEKENAVWLKTSEYGDDEDRVLVRSDGSASYFLGDIAYHDDKFSRGFDAVFNIWGADHAGHVKRMEAVKKMLQWQGEFRVFIVQMILLKGNDGARAKMSKRAGTVVLLEDLVEEVGIDVARWFFLEKALSTQMDFNLDLARDASEKNPVRYVQYAHARMCSILEKAGGEMQTPSEKNEKSEISLSQVLENPSARALALKVLQFPAVIEEITRNCLVNQLTTYVYELAGVFSGFYRDVRVIGEGGEVNREALEMVKITRETLGGALELLGISAPEKM
ncbi:MAG TPA: arginine--tRNA ligase [Candidatus Paceibacterota bacterium]|nr:arginine--tRNA ligase [Candidatus Paceibacterota bacterium]